MMNPAPTQPMRESLRRCSRGRELRERAMLLARVENKLEVRKQSRRIGLAVRHVFCVPLAADATKRTQTRAVGVSSSVENPIFLDCRYLEIELHITNEILLGVRAREHF